MQNMKMQAFRVAAQHEPAEIVEVSVPSPRTGEVLIRVGGAGLCASDLKVLNGADYYNIDYPLTLGHENAGWIEELGEGVADWQVGQAIVVSCLGGCGSCAQCNSGYTQYCASPVTPGITYDGGLAPYLVADAAQIVAIQDLSVPHAAPLADAGMTTYHAVDMCGDIFGRRESLLLIGMGGLGSLAIQIAKVKGWERIIVCDISEEKRDQAFALGATDFLVSSSQLSRDLNDMVGDDGVSAAIDLVGIDATLQAAVDVVRPGGRVVQVGTGSGTISFGRQDIKPGVSLVQSRGGSIGDLQAVVAMAQRGELKAEIDQIPLASVPDAYARMAAGKLTRRAVVVFDDSEADMTID